MEGNFNIKATKGFWTAERDRKLLEMVRTYGGKLSWSQLAKAFPGVRGKYIRERYRNHLDPQLKCFPWTWDEDQILKKCYLKFGNRWELISRYLPGRSANQVKNRTKRREFRELFPQPPSRKRAWDPTVYPSQLAAKHPKRTTIAAEERAIALKQEENHRRLREELAQEREQELVEEPPIPAYLQEEARRDQKRKLTKAQKVELASLHLQRTYDLIKQNLAKPQPSDFYLIFETHTKREIFTKIKAMQWTVTQLWPLVTNRSSRQCYGQETAFFLYCLIKADNALANKILHRLLKCAHEDYLMRKVERILEDIDTFIRAEQEIVRQKEMLERHNRPLSKSELLEANPSGTPKQELPRGREEEANAEVQRLTSEKDIKTEQTPTEYISQEHEELKYRVPEELLPQYDFDFAMLGKLKTISNQMAAERLDKRVKLEESSVQKEQAKAEVEAETHADNELPEQQSCREASAASPLELSSDALQKSSEEEAEIAEEIGSGSDSCSQLQLQAVAERVQLRPLHFFVSLTEERFPSSRACALPFYELEELSSSSGLEFYQPEASQEGSQLASIADSNEVLMRVKHENIEEEAKPLPVSLSSNFRSMLRSKILSKLQQKQSRRAVITIN